MLRSHMVILTRSQSQELLPYHLASLMANNSHPIHLFLGPLPLSRITLSWDGAAATADPNVQRHWDWSSPGGTHATKEYPSSPRRVFLQLPTVHLPKKEDGTMRRTKRARSTLISPKQPLLNQGHGLILTPLKPWFSMTKISYEVELIRTTYRSSMQIKDQKILPISRGSPQDEPIPCSEVVWQLQCQSDSPLLTSSHTWSNWSLTHIMHFH